jgi:hypothetical protein
MRAGIERFLAATKSDVEFYKNRFLELLNLVDPDNRKLNSAGQSSLHGRHLKPQDEDVYPDNIHENLVTALKKHATCVPSAHMSEPPIDRSSCHLTRFGLSTKGRNVKERVKFDLVVASMNFDFWQDFLLNIAV